MTNVFKIKTTDFADRCNNDECDAVLKADSISSMEISVDNGRLSVDLNGENVFYTCSLMDGFVEFIFEKPVGYIGQVEYVQVDRDVHHEHNVRMPVIKDINLIEVSVDNGRFNVSINGNPVDVIPMTDGVFKPAS